MAPAAPDVVAGFGGWRIVGSNFCADLSWFSPMASFSFFGLALLARDHLERVRRDRHFLGADAEEAAEADDIGFDRSDW